MDSDCPQLSLAEPDLTHQVLVPLGGLIDHPEVVLEAWLQRSDGPHGHLRRGYRERPILNAIGQIEPTLL